MIHTFSQNFCFFDKTYLVMRKILKQGAVVLNSQMKYAKKQAGDCRSL